MTKNFIARLVSRTASLAEGEPAAQRAVPRLAASVPQPRTRSAGFSAIARRETNRVTSFAARRRNK